MNFAARRRGRRGACSARRWTRVADLGLAGARPPAGRRPRSAHDLRRRAQRARASPRWRDSVPEGTVAVLSILDDKDAAEMLRALLPRLSAAVFTRAPNPRALPPATLADLAQKVGGDRDRDRARPAAGRRARAGARWRTWNRARDGIHLPRRRPAQRSGRAKGERAVNEGGPSVIAMIALVAFVVALVILIFFGIGYALRARLPVEGPPPRPLGFQVTHEPHARHLPDRGHQERGAADRSQRRAARPRRPLSRPDLLDVRGRAPPDRRPAAGRLRDAGVASSRSSGRSSI